MKRNIMFLAFFLLTISSVSATAESIYDYLQEVDQQYFLVLGLNGKGGDSLAAIDVAVSIKKFNRFSLDIETVIEGEINKEFNKILVGHPCDNSLIDLSCEEWPYKKGEAVIMVQGNDLIIAGTTVDDTRKAAKIIANYPKHSILKKELKVVVTGKGTKPEGLQKAKSKEEFVCGDLVCDPGESQSCFIDCAELTCFDICKQEGFSNAACRDKKSHPKVPSCLENEIDRGQGYCAKTKVCCCEKNQRKKPVQKETTELPNELSIRQELKGSFSAAFIFIIVIATLGISAILLLKKRIH
tara:strand:+ start:13661 stop:14554 length:894 start_codon:yes stop_codon:yes gene_type:complete